MLRKLSDQWNTIPCQIWNSTRHRLTLQSHFFLRFRCLRGRLRGGGRHDSVDESGHNSMHLINLWGKILASKGAQSYPEESDVNNAQEGKICENAGRNVESDGRGETGQDAAAIAGGLIPTWGMNITSASAMRCASIFRTMKWFCWCYHKQISQGRWQPARWFHGRPFPWLGGVQHLIHAWAAHDAFGNIRRKQGKYSTQAILTLKFSHEEADLTQAKGNDEVRSCEIAGHADERIVAKEDDVNAEVCKQEEERAENGVGPVEYVAGALRCE